jgi:hypothetical protein
MPALGRPAEQTSAAFSYTVSAMQPLRWKNYLACFLAGVFLIHILPHVLNGFSWMNLLAGSLSLAVGFLLLWMGKFSFRNLWTLVLLLAGMGSVLIYAAVHSHAQHENPPAASSAKQN